MTAKLLSKAITLSALLPFSSLSAQAYERIVVLTPDVADIVVALGSADKVVGKDQFNNSPRLAKAVSVGNHRNITAEPIMALKPDLVLGSHMAQPNSIYQRLNSLNVKAVNVAPQEDIASYSNSIKQIGRYLGRSSQANRLADKWNKQMAPKASTKIRYLLSYDGRIVAGKGTVGDELIKRAGGINAANVTGLKPLSREGWLAAKPDVIIIADHNQPVIGSVASFRQRPEIANSTAAKKNHIYFWDADEFLRYGLASPSVVNKLNQLAKQ
ncbi:heme/hemin ABC transporter substrate-binding protein [Psychrobacter sanguinis]|uniref:heme/hemin ABC transporter substrate-binding protein n=1 Tax=Psychrobacter sanguinis TaxID=861445 RepID=UPI00191B17D0|nr:ABC transporter substrate-binding protein [Psychrobacter sanguinis]MCC3344718.1 ABC transporter substrate-binding protein [Psychrobacter sanguinis]